MVIVVFRSRLRPDADLSALQAVGARMYELGSAMPGFLGYEEFAAEDGESLTLVQFETEEQLLAWRNHPEHLEAQARGRTEFFSEYSITVSQSRRAYHFNQADGRVNTQGTTTLS